MPVSPADPNAAPPLPRRRLPTSWRKRMLIVAATIAITLAVSATATVLFLRYILLPHLDAFRPQLEKALSRTLGAQVSITALSAQWQIWPRGIGWSIGRPAIDITQFTVRDATGQIGLTVPHIAATFSWRSLLHVRPTLESVDVDALQVMARRAANGRVSVAGIPFALTLDGHRNNAFIGWLLAQDAMTVRRGILHWEDAMRDRAVPAMAFTDLRFAMLNRGRSHHLNLHANIENIENIDQRTQIGQIDLQSQFQHQADADDNHSQDNAGAGDITRWTGTASINAHALNLSALSRYVSHYVSLPVAINDGQLNAHVAFKFGAGRKAQGKLSLASRHLSIKTPRLFDAPTLDFDTLNGQAFWRIEPVGGALRFSNMGIEVPLANLTFSLSHADAAGNLRATYQKKGNRPGFLNLDAQLQRAAIVRIPHYLPTSVNAKLRTYLGHALSAGQVHHATIHIAGEVGKETQTPMDYQIIAPFEGGRFDPTPQEPTGIQTGIDIDGTASTLSPIPSRWPMIEDIRGIFKLNRHALALDINHARYRHVTFKRISGQIDDLSTPTDDFVIDGNADGPLNDMLHYFRDSPLPAWTRFSAESMDVNGRANLALHFRIPRDGRTPLGVRGALKLADNTDNTLKIHRLPPLTKLTGQLAFTERSLTLKQINAQFLGDKVQMEGGVKPDGSFAIEALGQLSANALIDELCGDNCTAALLRQFRRRLTGNARYEVDFSAKPHTEPEITLYSDLIGVATDLPAPFTKAAHEPMPFYFKWQPIPVSVSANERDAGQSALIGNASAPLSEIHFQLGPLAAVYLRQGGERPTVLSGAIGLKRPISLKAKAFAGKDKSKGALATGVTAAADFNQLDLDAWRSIVAMDQGITDNTFGFGPNSGHRLIPAVEPYLPTHINAHFNTLVLAGRHWKNLMVHAARNTSQDHSAWQVNLNSEQIAGQLTWQSAAQKEKEASTDQSTLKARFSKFAGLGRVEMAARLMHTHHQTLWQLDQLELIHPAATLTATGQCTTLPLPLASPLNLNDNSTDDSTGSPTPITPTHRTAVKFKLAINDAGKLLEHFGLARTLHAGTGTLLGQLHWLGTTTTLDHSTLAGALSLNLQHGQILRAEPGISKLLGVLSLQGLMHFLTFGFQDILEEGLTFEQIRATGAIRDGKVNTDDFTITSINARITMKGVADLIKEQQNLLVTVKPTINMDSAALAATVVHPLLGVGSYIAQRMLLASISRNFTAQYKVSGAWADPQIEEIK